MKIYKTEYHDRFTNQTFIMVTKSTGYFKPGEVVTFVRWPDELMIRQAMCIAVRSLNRKELTPEISFLAENCDLDIFNEILDMRKMDANQELTISTFTHPSNSRKYYDIPVPE